VRIPERIVCGATMDHSSLDGRRCEAASTSR